MCRSYNQLPSLSQTRCSSAQVSTSILTTMFPSYSLHKIRASIISSTSPGLPYQFPRATLPNFPVSLCRGAAPKPSRRRMRNRTVNIGGANLSALSILEILYFILQGGECGVSIKPCHEREVPQLMRDGDEQVR